VAFIGEDLGHGDGAELERWIDSLAPGAVVLSFDRTAPEEMSRRFLCAGLVDLRQRQVGRRCMTSGRVPPPIASTR
jgi:hypothetical protein